MQKVLITAGATGIGYTLAEQFSQAGYQMGCRYFKRRFKKCPKSGA